MMLLNVLFKLSFTVVLLSFILCPVHADPKMICYSVQPNAYLNDHAKEIAEIYDGFYFPIGQWDDGAERFLGTKGNPPSDSSWMEKARENVKALNEAGASENFLTVSFGADAPWPSSETLLSKEYTQRFADCFAAVGRCAKELGFRGVCIDVEYPYPRYQLDHEIYKYEQYTAEELMEAALRQGRVSMEALLEKFPDAVIILLPGAIRARPLERQYQLGLLEVMAEWDAPGGLHIGTEFTYCLHDPVTIAATTRFEDCGLRLIVRTPQVVSYWKRCCTMAPGVWPLHIVETESTLYPVRPWKEEIAELREEMAILRTLSKRYIWSYTGNPVWYIHTPDIEAKYGLGKQNLKRKDIDLRDWHTVLKEKTPPTTPGLEKVFKKIREFDADQVSSEELCDAFGTPGRWWALGMLSNPHTEPAFAAVSAATGPIDPQMPHHGRDGVVRWFAFDNLDPRGSTSGRYLFDWFHTDNSSAHFVTCIHSEKEHQAILHTGWDDGIVIRLGDTAVFDQAEYPQRGHGMLYLDRYLFEKHVPIVIPKGETRLSVTSINSHGVWGFSLRITDGDQIPFEDVRFRLE